MKRKPKSQNYPEAMTIVHYGKPTAKQKRESYAQAKRYARGIRPAPAADKAEAKAGEVERLASELHAVYQVEANRQKDVRHFDEYNALSENIKDYDRALAKFVIERDSAIRREALEEADKSFIKAYQCGMLVKGWNPDEATVRGIEAIRALKDKQPAADKAEAKEGK